MQERPDHLVEFHVTLPLKTPTPVTQVPHASGVRSGIFHRFRVRRQGPGDAGFRAIRMHGDRCQTQAARGRRQAETLGIVLHQSRARNQFRIQNGERRHRGVPMTKRSIVRIGLGWAAWSASVVAAAAQLAQRPFAVAGGEGGGGGEGGLTGWLMAEQSSLTHLMAAKVHALNGQSQRRLGPDRPWPCLWRGARRRPRTRQGGPRLLHAGQRNLAQTRRGDGADGGAASGADRDRARRRGRVCLSGDRFTDEARSRLDRARKLLQRRRHRRLAGLAKGRGAPCGPE